MRNFKNKSLLLILGLAVASLSTSGNSAFDAYGLGLFKNGLAKDAMTDVATKATLSKLDGLRSVGTTSKRSMTNTSTSSAPTGGATPEKDVKRSSSKKKMKTTTILNTGKNLLKSDGSSSVSEDSDEDLDSASSLYSDEVAALSRQLADVQAKISQNEKKAELERKIELKNKELKAQEEKAKKEEEKRAKEEAERAKKEEEEEEKKADSKKSKKKMKGVSELKKGVDSDDEAASEFSDLNELDAKKKDLANKLKGFVEDLDKATAYVEKSREEDLDESRSSRMSRRLSGMISRVAAALKAAGEDSDIMEEWTKVVSSAGAKEKSKGKMLARIDALRDLIYSLGAYCGDDFFGDGGGSVAALAEEFTGKSDAAGDKGGSGAAVNGKLGEIYGGDLNKTTGEKTSLSGKVVDPSMFSDFLGQLKTHLPTGGSMAIYRMLAGMTCDELFEHCSRDKKKFDETASAQYAAVKSYCTGYGVPEAIFATVGMNSFRDCFVPMIREQLRKNPELSSPDRFIKLEQQSQQEVIRDAVTEGQKNVAKLIAVICYRLSNKFTYDQYYGVVSGKLGHWLELLRTDLQSSSNANNNLLQSISEVVRRELDNPSATPFDKDHVAYWRSRLDHADVDWFKTLKNYIDNSFESDIATSLSNARQSAVKAQTIYTELKKQYEVVYGYENSTLKNDFQRAFFTFMYRLYDRNSGTGGRTTATYYNTGTAVKKAVIDDILGNTKKVIDLYDSLISSTKDGEAVVSANLTRWLADAQLVSVPMNRLFKLTEILKMNVSHFINSSKFSEVTSAMENPVYRNYMQALFKEAEADGTYTTVYDIMLIAYVHTMLVVRTLMASSMLGTNAVAGAAFYNYQAACALGSLHTNQCDAGGTGFSAGVIAQGTSRGNLRSLFNALAGTVGTNYGANEALTQDFTAGGAHTGHMLLLSATRLKNAGLIKSHKGFLALRPPGAGNKAISEDFISDGAYNKVAADTTGAPQDRTGGNPVLSMDTTTLDGTDFALVNNCSNYIGSIVEVGPAVSRADSFANVDNSFKALEMVHIKSLNGEGLNRPHRSGDADAAHGGRTQKNGVGGINGEATLDHLIPDSDIKVLGDFGKSVSDYLDKEQWVGNAAGVEKGQNILLRKGVNLSGTTTGDTTVKADQAIDKIHDLKLTTNVNELKLNEDEVKKLESSARELVYNPLLSTEARRTFESYTKEKQAEIAKAYPIFVSPKSSTGSLYPYGSYGRALSPYAAPAPYYSRGLYF